MGNQFLTTEKVTAINKQDGEACVDSKTKKADAEQGQQTRRYKRGEIEEEI